MPVVLAPVTVGTRWRAVLAGGFALVLALGACGEEPTRTEQFCDRLRDGQSVLVTLPPTPDALAQVVEAYRSVEEVAPLAIEEDWTVIASLVAAAAAVDPADPVAVERVRTDAIAATQAVQRVTTFARETCGVSLDGLPVPTTPVTLPDGSTIPPVTVPAGTLPPSSG
jgi:hypothetical protein